MSKLTHARKSFILLISGIIILIVEGIVQASTIDELIIVPPNPTSSDYIYVNVQGSWWGRSAAWCMPANPTVSIVGKEIQINYAAPSSTVPPSFPCVVGDSLDSSIGSPWADSISITQTIGALEAGTYQLVISETGGVMVRTTLTVTSKKDIGGLSTGMTARRIVCKNLTTGKSKVVASNADTWNCEAAGLKVKPGDKVWMTVKGVANTAP